MLGKDYVRDEKIPKIHKCVCDTYVCCTEDSLTIGG